jgi:spore germination cell wall hydrolase CwlJ-like protein
MGLVVSISADAGQDASIGASLAPITSLAPDMPRDLVPPLNPILRSFGRSPILLRRDVQLASHVVGDMEELMTPSDEIEPRRDLKRNAKVFPTLDRSHKGDPRVGLRPSFDARLRQPGGVARVQASELMLGNDDYLTFEGFAPSGGMVPGPDSVAQFEQQSEIDPGSTTQATTANISPGQTGSAPTLRLHSSARSLDGATPATPRAVVLSSSTPAADQDPVQVVEVHSGNRGDGIVAPTSVAPNSTLIARTPGERPNYAALLADPDTAAREERCLAEAVYFESRSEPEEGQVAVAQVVLNRVQSGLYPTSICGVVFQNRHRRNACQFSFACEGKALRITEPEPWKIATRIAREVLEGKLYVSDVGASTHYHANYVRPRWARALKKMDVIGNHIFYKLRPGQT